MAAHDEIAGWNTTNKTQVQIPAKPQLHGVYPIYVILSLLGIVLNLFLIVLFMKRRSLLNKVTNRMLLNQSIVDLFNSCIVCPVWAVNYRYYRNIKRESSEETVVEKLFWPVAAFSTLLSLFCFTLIAAQRMHSTFKPLAQNSVRQKKCIHLSTIPTWFLTAVLSVSFFLDAFMPPSWKEASMNSVAVKLFGMALFLANVIIYAITYCKAKSHLKKNPSVRGKNTIDKEKRDTMKKKEMKLTKAFMLMFVGFTSGFLMGVVSLILQITKHRLSTIVSETSFIIFGCSAILNPLLAIRVHRDVRARVSNVRSTVHEISQMSRSRYKNSLIAN